MSFTKQALVGAAAAFAAFSLFTLLSQSPKNAVADDAKPFEMKMAVVNIEEVFNNLKERAVREEDLNRRKEALRTEIQKMTDEADDLLKQHDAMAPDDPKRNETQEKIVQLQSDAEFTSKKGMAALQKRELSDRQELYAMIRDAVDKYAAENKLTLVLKVEDKRVSDNPDLQNTEVAQRTVLYSDASLNITQEIIKVLNK
jgi:Skp family chaperone for outer membrane proteins